MPDQVLVRDGPVSVPMDYKVPQGGELLPLTVRATMDGTSAASAFYATVQVIAPSGRVMGSAISSSIAAGASADVTWFPRVAATQQGSGPVPVGPGAIVWDYTVTAASKASIDTLTDGSYAGSLPQGFNVLEVWGMIRTDEASVTSQCAMYFNNDSTVGNYNVQYVYGSNVTPTAGNNTAPPGFDVHGSGGTANYPGIFQVSIPGYAQTSFFKMALGGEGRVDADVTRQTSLWQIIGWRNTAAINRIVLVPFAPATALLLGSRMMIMAR